ncbi:DUF2157 domain-containing protein [uncultured Cohaesibacter sp.]|uniref:DUF2157 domain-containing protein n=1 Tax=uncultured Cohaesibacter sp. TaxID=1002546 RepID=UPI0029C75328|nr:DUF2157 domain-containing protein [uncultured Cohaesibacter sp.]
MTPEAEVPSDQKRLNSISLDRHLLDELARRGVITPQLRQASLDWLHPPRAWAHWAMILLLAFGTGLILSGIVFFFAFNWASIPDLAKLGMIEAGVIAAAVGSWLMTLDRLIGRLLLLVASMLVGVFLATFGQIYQSGADPWQLFALWALLITPWTILSRLSALWLIWFGLLNTAIYLWWEETLGLTMELEPYLYFTLACLSTLALALREWLAPSASSGGQGAFCWLEPLWIRWLLVAASLAGLFPLLIGFVDDIASGDDYRSNTGPLSCIILIGFYITFRYLRRDIPVLAMTLLVICLLVVIGIAILLDSNDADALVTTLLTGIAAIASFGSAAGYLRKLLGADDETDGEGAHV